MQHGMDKKQQGCLILIKSRGYGIFWSRIIELGYKLLRSVWQLFSENSL